MNLQSLSWHVVCYAIISFISFCFMSKVRSYAGGDCYVWDTLPGDATNEETLDNRTYRIYTCGAHMYCDSDNLCRCSPEYPVMLDSHTCAKARRHGEYCKDNLECMHLDENSFCNDDIPVFGFCDCKSDCTYDPYVGSCVKGTLKREETVYFLVPVIIGCVCFACFCVTMCVAILRKPRIQEVCKTYSFSICSCFTPSLLQQSSQRSTSSNPHQTLQTPPSENHHQIFQTSASAQHVDGISATQAPEEDTPPPYESLVLLPSAPPAFEEAIKLSTSSVTKV